MDARGHIYEDDPEKIPAEDKARLDGYLRARAEADETKAMRERLAALHEREKPLYDRLATPEQDAYVGTPDDGYRAAHYIWQTPYESVTEWTRAIIAAIPEDERCPHCQGRGRTVIYAGNGGPSEFPVCWMCEGSRRRPGPV